MATSNLSGFYRLNVSERRKRLADVTGLTDEEINILSGTSGLSVEQADNMVENALGVLNMPLGLCVNLRVNNRDRLVPMAIEEPSVVAAASHGAKLLRDGGGITTTVTPPHMIGQIQVLDVPDFDEAQASIYEARDELIELANSKHSCLVSAGGGAFGIEVNRLLPLGEDDPVGEMLIVHLFVDVRDAMGANAINSMCERLAPRIGDLTRGRVGLRILSNLSDQRRVIASGSVPFSALDGKGCGCAMQLSRGIVEASVFAERDPYRAATHNKGIMNGVDAVLLAFGQDWRAVEAGAHAFASRNGRYTALAHWRIGENELKGHLEIPMAVGVVGGIVKVHPTVRVAHRVARVESASDLAALAAAVGLAQNLSALRALAAEGIQKGHMRLHARNIAVQAGASGEDIDHIARKISEQGTINLIAASSALRKLKRMRYRTELSSHV